MITSKIVINWREGLHLRVASLLVKTTRTFHSTVRLRAGGQIANATSFMQLLMLGASLGTVLTLEADGPDEREAVQAVTQLLASPEVTSVCAEPRKL